MGLIACEGMHFHAYHGVYDEEQLTGNDFMVDVYIETSLEPAAATDDIHNAINYETIFFVCKTVMNKETELIETLLFNLIAALKKQFATIQEVKVRVTKFHPLGAERMERAYVESEDSFVSGCPRCGSPFICYNDDNCWCKDVKLHPGTLASIQQKYQGCLCNSCLAFYAD